MAIAAVLAGVGAISALGGAGIFAYGLRRIYHGEQQRISTVLDGHQVEFTFIYNAAPSKRVHGILRILDQRVDKNRPKLEIETQTENEPSEFLRVGLPGKNIQKITEIGSSRRIVEQRLIKEFRRMTIGEYIRAESVAHKDGATDRIYFTDGSTMLIHRKTGKRIVE